MASNPDLIPASIVAAMFRVGVGVGGGSAVLTAASTVADISGVETTGAGGTQAMNEIVIPATDPNKSRAVA